MKTNIHLLFMMIASINTSLLACTEVIDRSSENRVGDDIENIDLENHDDLPDEEIDSKGKCKDKTLKDEPGECGCQFEDKDIDGDGEIDCPKLVIPHNALPKLEEIPGKCAEWEYPKHHIIEYPVLPEYGYEVTIDTEKYKISRIYDISKADETTKGLNQAIKDYKEQGYTRIVIPPGHYPLTSQGIKPGSNVAIIMSNDVILQMIPVQRWDCGLFSISKAENIYIEGGTLIGEKYEHTASKPGSTDEECGGFQISGSGHIFINGVKIKSVHGDGIMIYDYTEKDKETIAKDIIIANCDIDDVFRNGIAIVGLDGIRISNNHIHHTSGTDPQLGIDFEPNNRSRINFRPIIDHNTFNDNVAGDLILYGMNTFVEYNLFDIGDLTYVSDNPFIAGANVSTFIFYRNKASKPIRNTGCSNQLYCSYRFTRVDGIAQIPNETQNPYPSFFVENDIPNQRVQLTLRDKLCIKSNIIHEGHLSFSGIRNVRVFDNRVEKFAPDADKAAYSCKSIYGGKAGGNVVCKLDDNGAEVCTEYTGLNNMEETPSDQAYGHNTQWY